MCTKQNQPSWILQAFAVWLGLVFSGPNSFADLVAIAPAAFPAGSTLITFSGLADGTNVNGLTFGGISFSYLLLIRLFQQDTSGSLGCRAPSPVSEDLARIPVAVFQRRGLPTIFGRVPLVGGLSVSPMREPASLRIGETQALAMCRLSAPSFADGWDDPAQHENPLDGLVLGRLPDDHR